MRVAPSRLGALRHHFPLRVPYVRLHGHGLLRAHRRRRSHDRVSGFVRSHTSNDVLEKRLIHVSYTLNSEYVS